MTDEPTPNPEARSGPARAGDIMTRTVVSVPPDMPARDIAGLLLKHRISAVPVVDPDGIPIGIVSEGDLIGRDAPARVARLDWWLGLISGARPLESLETDLKDVETRTARDVMAAPIVAVNEDTPAAEIARLLAIHHIKRVPVLHDGRLAGIVSRADLLTVVANGRSAEAEARTRKPAGGFLKTLFGDYHLPAWETVAGIRAAQEAANPPPPPVDESRLAAEDFRHLVEDFHQEQVTEREATRRAAVEKRRERAKQLIDEHVFDEGWRDLLHRARVAAEHGETESLLLRFPSSMCLDDGRMINTGDPNWPSALRGRPAELYLLWERDLKPRHFGLSARILDYPGGMPGDVGLFLRWAG